MVATRRTRLVLVWFSVVFLMAVAAACSGQGSGTAGPAGNRIVALLVEGNSLRLSGAFPDDDGVVSRAPEPGEQGLHWELHDASNAVVASGDVADPRVVRMEFDERGNAAPAETQAPLGVLELRIPNVGGTLYVYEGAASGSAPQSFGRPALSPQSSPANSLIGSLPVPPPGSRSPGTPSGAPTKIVDHGDCAPVNFLLVPEGYTQAELGKFKSDATSAAARMQAYRGYSDHWNEVNVWILDTVASKDSGITDPGCTPKGPGYDPNCPNGPHPKVTKDTAFGTSFGDNSPGQPRRLIYARGTPAPHPDAYAAMAAAKRQSKADVVGLVVNVTEWGGAGDSAMLTFSTNPGAPFLWAHESGHALFGLHDEYTYGVCNPGAGGLAGAEGPNTSAKLASLPWAGMVNTSTIPTLLPDPSTIGAYEGAAYCPKGVYRGQFSCMMREAGAEMCAVCRRQMDRIFAQKAAGKASCKDAGTDAAIGADGGIPPPNPVPLDGSADIDAGDAFIDAGSIPTCGSKPDGTYCADQLGGSDNHEYRCISGELFDFGPCPGSLVCVDGQGCTAAEAGAPLGTCSGRADGLYCGGDIGAPTSDVYYCSAGQTFDFGPCRNGTSCAGGQCR